MGGWRTKVGSVGTGLGVTRRSGVERRGVLTESQRVSKPGRRVYSGARDIPPVKRGLGVSIVSTSAGVMTDRDARRRNVGGEVLCRVW